MADLVDHIQRVLAFDQIDHIQGVVAFDPAYKAKKKQCKKYYQLLRSSSLHSLNVSYSSLTRFVLGQNFGECDIYRMTNE